MADNREPIHGTCWTQDRARAILQAVALANNEAEFLAVHQPIRDFVIATTTGQSMASTDDALLADLSEPETRHAFCVIEGEPGAGKSHLIRWLQVKWTGNDLVMLIERADGSLTGALRQLRDQLGQKYAHLFNNLSHSIEATFDGRVRIFHANLAASLSRGFFIKEIGDEGWCADWNLEQLIGNAIVQEKWSGPERILKVISGDGGQRNSASANFDLNDLVGLARLEFAAEGLPPKAMMLMRKLKRECDRIEPALAEGSSAEVLLDEDIEIPESRRLLSALNRRRDFAVQLVLGISVDGLKDMFLQLRKELLSEKRRLVLLLEDVTSWEGIDGQLIDSLVVDARTRSDVCDMISVVGMTPLYLKDIQGNYRGRITQLIQLGRQRDAGEFQETIQLASTEAQVEFAAAYLRAIRVDKPELDAWHASGANPDIVPNHCTGCSSRERCFAAFGSHGSIGLYPFNRNAITNMFEALEDPKGSQNLQTPRGMIQGVLSPVLLNPARLDQGEFPPVEIEFSEWMPERKLQAPVFLEQVIDAAEPEPERRDQLRRLVMLWGDRSQGAAVTLDAEGQKQFNEIAADIFETFGLPWLGEGLESLGQLGSHCELPRDALDERTSDGETAHEPRRASRSLASGRAVSEGRGQGSAPSVSPAKLRVLLQQAQAWRDGKSVGDPTAWEGLLVDLMIEVRGTLADPVPGLWDKLFTKESVRLEGMGKTDARHFVIPREAWTTRGIEGYVLLLQGEALPPVQRESTQRAVAHLVCRLAEFAKSHVERRLVFKPDTWSIAGAIAQVLLARAWLRGAISPSDPLAKQFARLLQPEQESRSMPTERVESWSELIKATDYSHDKFRELLRSLLLLPLGSGAPLYNAGIVADDLEDLLTTMRTVAVPDKAEFSRGLEEIAKLIDLTKQTDASLRLIPSREALRLTERKARALALLRQTTLNHHLNRVSSALDEAAKALAEAGPLERQAYFTARQRVADEMLLDETSDAWATLRDYLLQDDSVADAEAQADRLSRLLSVPVATLRLALDALENAEKAVSAAYAHASAYVKGHQSEGDLTAVHAFGARLAETGEAVRARLAVSP
jgi:hypothetical protein